MVECLSTTKEGDQDNGGRNVKPFCGREEKVKLEGGKRFVYGRKREAWE